MKKFPSLLGAATRPMTNDESTLFITACMHSAQKPAAQLLNSGIAAQLGLLGEIMHARLEWADVPVEDTLAVWVLSLSYGNPAHAVLWAWTLRELYIEGGGVPVSLTQWTQRFPLGVPTDEEYIRVWDAQKEYGAHAGNGIDMPSRWAITDPLPNKIV